MSYNSISEFQLTAFPSGSFKSINPATIAFYQDDAYATINDALRVHNNVPLQNPPGNIKAAETIIACYRLMLFTGLLEDASQDELERRYREIVGSDDKADSGLLGKLASGKIILDPILTGNTKPYVPTILTTAKGSNWLTYNSNGKQFIR